MSSNKDDIRTDDAIAQGLASAIATRAHPDNKKALVLAAYVVEYVRAITETSPEDFLRELQTVIDSGIIKVINLPDEYNETKEMPLANAPISKIIQ